MPVRRRTVTGSRHIDAALLLALLGCAVLILLVWWGAPAAWAEPLGQIIGAAMLAVGGSSLRESVGKLGPRATPGPPSGPSESQEP